MKLTEADLADVGGANQVTAPSISDLIDNGAATPSEIISRVFDATFSPARGLMFGFL